MRNIIIIDEQRRQRAVEAVRDCPINSKVTIGEADLRNLEQNALLHALLSDISKQVEHQGMKFNVTVWKRLCTAAYLREIRESPMLIPAIDDAGRIDIIYEKTSKMGKKKVAGLIEWVYSYGAENNVKWSK